MSAIGKLHRSDERVSQCPLRVEISWSVLSPSRKRTLAAMQNVGKMGLFRTLAARPIISGNAGLFRRCPEQIERQLT